MNVGAWPGSVPLYRAWRIALVDEVVAASARPDEAFTWITSVSANATDADMQNTNYPWSKSMGFDTLDAKLASALTKILQG